MGARTRAHAHGAPRRGARSCNGLCEDCCHDYECNYHRGEDDDYGDYDDYW